MQKAIEGMVEKVDKPQAPAVVVPVVQEEDTRKVEISKTVARVSGLVIPVVRSEIG